MTEAPAYLDMGVIEGPGDEEGLRQGWAALIQGVEASHLSLHKRFPLWANPPPDTLFMRATGIDLVVFGMDYEGTEVQILDHATIVDCELYQEITELVETKAKSTAATLATYARARQIPCDEAAVREALDHGTWPMTQADAMLQVAAFAYHLRKALWIAAAAGRNVVWVYSNAAWIDYTYPS